MSSEVLYLESCLAIEKSIDEVNNAFTEGSQSIEEGFLFESPKDVFETIKNAIIKMVEKIKSIFKGKAAKEQTAKIDKAGKAKKGAKVECADSNKIVSLFNKAKAAIARGKESGEVQKWFKRGLIALGVIGAAGATYGGVKHFRKKKINAEDAGKESAKIDNTASVEAEKTKKQAFAFLSNFKKAAQKGQASKDGEKSKGLTSLLGTFSQAMSGAKRSIVSGLGAIKGKFSNTKASKGKKSSSSSDSNESYQYSISDYMDMEESAYDDILEESYDDDFDDDLFGESYDDEDDDLFGESYDTEFDDSLYDDFDI